MVYNFLDLEGLTRVASNIMDIIKGFKNRITGQVTDLGENMTTLETKVNQLESGIDWKESVNTYNDIITTYPNPQNGWTVNTKDTNYTYRYNGSAWVAISANAIPNATQYVNGLMTTAQVTKLNSLENYVLPVADTNTLGGIMPDGITLTVDVEGYAHAIGEDKSLESLTDTQISYPSNGQVLKYNSSLRKWVNDAGDGIRLSDVSGANVSISAGDTSAYLTWTDPVDVIVGTTTLAAWEGTKIVRKLGSAPQNELDGTLVIDSKTRNNYSSTPLEDSGLIYGNTYYYRFFPYTTSGLYTAGTSVSIVPEKIVIEIPVQVGTLTYNGSEQSPVLSNNTGYTKQGWESATEASNYDFMAIPNANCKWTDGTEMPKRVDWVILPDAEQVFLSTDDVILNQYELSRVVTVYNLNGRAIESVEVEIPNIATATISGNTIIISHHNQESGMCEVTINIGAYGNYDAVTTGVWLWADFHDNELDNCSWEEIQTAAQNGTASSLWNVGDCKSITFENATIGDRTISGTYHAFILGFNHNSTLEGNNTIHFQFAFNTDDNTKPSFRNTIGFFPNPEGYGYEKNTQAFNMNTENTAIGGWESCGMRNTLIPQFRNALPNDLRAVLKHVNKYTNNAGTWNATAADVTATSDDIFLLSVREVREDGGSEYEAIKNAQYEYYVNGNSRLFYGDIPPYDADPEANPEVIPMSYWLRSPAWGNEYCFHIIDSNHSLQGSWANVEWGFCPAFVVG